MKRIVIALGGNALLQKGDNPDFETQYRRAMSAVAGISEIIADYETVITHGNGPQVGDILLQNEIAEGSIPKMPLHACGAMSQGLIAEAILLAYDRVSSERGISKQMASVVSRTLVDPGDSAFSNPSKPVGPFYAKDRAAELIKAHSWPMKEFPGKGWRRLVPSPDPLEILEKRAILNLLVSNFLPLGVGGGGIPVVKETGGYRGVEAVIDKDLASAVLARDIEADILMILTDVDNVYLDYNKETSRPIDDISFDDLEILYNSGEFEQGSMGPKVRAALNFIRTGGKEVHITSLSNGQEALENHHGTSVFRN